MKAPLWVAAIVAAALAVCAAAVLGLGDGATLAAPPEAVAEGFVRALARHRYAQALPYLTPELRAVGVDGLRRRLAEIERLCGEVRDARGLRGRRSGDAAQALVLVRTPRGPSVLRFTLARRRGEWRLASLGERSAAEDGDGVGR